MVSIRQQVSLLPYNTFHIEAVSERFAEVRTVEELQFLIHSGELQHGYMVIGGGSNLLLTQDVKGLVIKNSIKGVEATNAQGTTVLVRAGAGENWHQLVQWCIARQYAGIENLSLIPGQVGAAPMQNIGAYGVELKDVFHSLEAVDAQSGELVSFTKEDCAFGYRESVFKNRLKGRYIIVSVTLSLTNLAAPNAGYTCRTDYGDIQKTLQQMGVTNPDIHSVSKAVIAIRSSKLPDPDELGNAGSFFKNPVVEDTVYHQLIEAYPDLPGYLQPDGRYKLAAGWLIEKCGWKGKVVGQTGAHAKQALVLVNYGHATGAEIWALAKTIQESVYQTFGVLIEPEVNVI